jgi:nucleoside 2-deoxyribosyltransferase
MKFYIASKLENYRNVQAVRDALIKAGHRITYDWTLHGSVAGQGAKRLREVAGSEMDGVLSADIVIVLLPGGRGTHAELGMAIAWDIPVMLIADKSNTYFNLDKNTCAFYWNKNVQQCICLDAEALPGFVVDNIKHVAA